MISIYEKNAADFGNNGIGTLNPISCVVTETLNGNYEVVMTHPIDETGKYARIQEERIIKVPVPAGKTPRIAAGVGAGTLRIYKIVTDGRRLYLRAAPSQDAKGIKTYKPGTEVVVIDSETNDKWSEVETPDGKHGWMWTGNLSYVRTEATNEAADSIKEAAILREQPFRIYKVEPTLTTVTAYARHIFYDLMDNMVSEYKPAKTTTGAAAFIGLAGATEDGHGFTFYSDLDSTAEEVEITDKNPAEAILGDGGLVENYGGELARDWWDVYLVKRVGEETGIQIREGKNLLGIKYSVDITNCATRIVPKGTDKDGKPLYLPEKWIENPAEDKAVYINHKYSVLEVKDAKEKTKGDDKRTKEECYSMMRKAAEDAFEKGADLPDVTLNVDFIDCAETEEYRQYRFLQGIHMGDTVRVVARRVGVEVAMRMTQYSYNCLTKRYEKMTLGTIDATIEGNMINPRSIGSGTIKGSMIKLGGIGSGQIEDGAVNGLKIALAAIEYAHIGTAAIDQLSANAITAIRADIRELVAGNITTDQLYADLAEIAAAQITAANIEKANIQWAQIENLSAEIAKVVNAEIENLEVDWAGIYEADIEWANITNLTAEIAKITAAEIGKAKINWAQIVDVKIGTADIEDASINTAKIALGAITQALIAAGAIGTAQIADGSITDAKIVSLNADVIKSGTLSTDRLLIKGAGGLFYEINATAGGLTSTQLTEEQYKNAISGTALVARSVTADKIAAKSITANEILGQTITAAEINVANLFAADATIAALDNYILRTQTIEAIEGKLDVWASDKIRLAVEDVQIGGRNYILGTAEPYTAVGTGERQWLFPWPCASVEAANSLFGKTVTISFDCDVAITSGEFHIQIGELWWGVRRFDSGTPSGHFTWTSAIDTPSSPTDESFIYIDGTWTGSVTFSNMKVEIGNKETDWTPAPEDTDAAIAQLSAAVSIQAGEITSNATKIETVSQAAGNAQSAANSAQNTANAAQNAASGAQSTASGAVTRVTAAEQRISAVEGEITSKVSKTEFDVLGNTVSQMSTEIRQNEEEILLLAGRKYGGRNYILGTGTPYTAVGTGTRQWLYPWRCASSEAANRLFGNTVTISFDYDAAITSGSLLVQTNILWWGVQSFGVGTESNHFSLTRKYDAATTADDVFIYLDGTWTGSVTFRNLKVEIGDMVTDWTPAPEDAAKSVDTGGAVRIDQTGVHMSGGTIEMEASDGDEYIHIRNNGISATSFRSPDVTPRYSGPTGLYVNPNATSAQIAAGNYFRSLTDALATINNRMLDYNVGISMTSGMSDFTDAVISGVYGDGSILIYGENATVYGTVTVRNSHAQVHISQLHVAIPSGVEHAAYDVRNAFLTAYTCTMSGNNKAFHVEQNGYLDARNCVFKVNAEYSAYVLRSTASFEECIGNGYMVCHRGNMTAYGKVPIGGVAYWESCVPNNVSSLIPTGADGTPAAPVISTATYNYTSSDSYAGAWGRPGTDAAQGFIRTDSSGTTAAIYGTIWFDAAAIRSALNGKAIKQASLRLTMLDGYGRDTAVGVQLYGTNAAYSGRSGQPALTTSYGTIATTEPGAVSEITIPTAVISDIVNGTIQALVLKSDDSELYKDRDYSKNYARFAGSATADGNTCPRLTVVYQ